MTQEVSYDDQLQKIINRLTKIRNQRARILERLDVLIGQFIAIGDNSSVAERRHTEIMASFEKLKLKISKTKIRETKITNELNKLMNGTS